MQTIKILLIFLLFTFFFALETEAQKVEKDYLYSTLPLNDSLTTTIDGDDYLPFGIRFPSANCPTDSMSIWTSNYLDSTFQLITYDDKVYKIKPVLNKIVPFEPKAIFLMNRYYYYEFDGTATPDTALIRTIYGKW